MSKSYTVGYMPKPSYSGTKYEELKDVLKESGIISENTPDNAITTVVEESLVDLKPENIRGNVKIGEVSGTLATNWQEVNVENVDSAEYFAWTLVFEHPNGVDVYGVDLINNYESPLYHYSKLTKAVTTISDNTVSSSDPVRYFLSHSNQLYPIVDGYVYYVSGNNFIKLGYVGSNKPNVFEASNGNIYCCSSNTSSGTGSGMIYLITPEARTTVYNNEETYSSWQYFFQFDDNTILVSGNKGMLKINTDTNTCEKISVSSVVNTCKKHNGVTYFSHNYSSSNIGIYAISEDFSKIEQIVTVGSWEFFVSSKGTLYAYASYNSSKLELEGILVLNDYSYTQIYDSGYDNWTFVEDGLKNLYAFYPNTTSPILLIEGSDVTVIKGVLGTVPHLSIVSKNGYVYVCAGYGINKERGLFKLYDKIIEKIEDKSMGLDTGVELEDGTIYLSNYNGQAGSKGVYHLKNGVLTQIILTGKWKFLKYPKGAIAINKEEFVKGATAFLLQGASAKAFKL